MAQKDFSQMTTKKLRALYKSANEEDKLAIEKVLSAREQNVTTEEAATEEAATEKAATEETTKKAPKMTDEDRHALAEELKANIGRKCQVVPFGTIEWIDGYIAGVIEDKKANKVLYSIKAANGKKIIKTPHNPLLRIFEERVDVTIRSRAAKTEKVEWTPEIVEAEMNKVSGNVGRIAQVTKNENAISARIIAISADKRVNKLLYKLVEIETGKIFHKVTNAADIVIAEDFDDEGLALNTKFIERRQVAANRAALTPEDRVLACEESVKKAQEKVQKAEAELEAKRSQLEDAKAELEKYLAEQSESLE